LYRYTSKIKITITQNKLSTISQVKKQAIHHSNRLALSPIISVPLKAGRSQKPKNISIWGND